MASNQGTGASSIIPFLQHLMDKKVSLAVVGSGAAFLTLYKLYSYLSNSDGDENDKEKEEQKKPDGDADITENEELIDEEKWKQFIENDTHYNDPVGLPNLGNTCYMNALLQVLCGSYKFMNYVKKIWHTVKVTTDDDHDIYISIRLLQLLLNLSNGSKETDPKTLYDLLCESDFTKIEEQMDSHELLIFLQEKITKVVAQYIRRCQSDQGLAGIQWSDNDMFLLNQEHHTQDSESEKGTEMMKQIEQQVDQQSDSQMSLDGSLFKSKNKLSQSYYQNAKENLKLSDLLITKRLGINPFAGVYQSTITCQNCGPSGRVYRYEVAYDLSLNMAQTLEQALNNYFKGEYIDDYTCIRCSIRIFLKDYPKETSQIGDKDTREAIEFLYEIMNTHDLDQEVFVQKWKEYKKQTGNSCRLTLNQMKCRIIKKFSLLTPPKIMSIHLKRLSYTPDGQTYLNRQFIQYPDILDLNKIENMKLDTHNISLKYQLTGIIEHFGLSGNSGHYVAYRPLYPHAYTNQTTPQDPTLDVSKWVLCDDSRVIPINKSEALTRVAYMLIYQRMEYLTADGVTDKQKTIQSNKQVEGDLEISVLKKAVSQAPIKKKSLLSDIISQGNEVQQ